VKASSSSRDSAVRSWSTIQVAASRTSVFTAYPNRMSCRIGDTKMTRFVRGSLKSWRSSLRTSATMRARRSRSSANQL
jgi:hypothetical protein